MEVFYLIVAGLLTLALFFILSVTWFEYSHEDNVHLKYVLDLPQARPIKLEYYTQFDHLYKILLNFKNVFIVLNVYRHLKQFIVFMTAIRLLNKDMFYVCHDKYDYLIGRVIAYSKYECSYAEFNNIPFFYIFLYPFIVKPYNLKRDLIEANKELKFITYALMTKSK